MSEPCRSRCSTRANNQQTRAGRLGSCGQHPLSGIHEDERIDQSWRMASWASIEISAGCRPVTTITGIVRRRSALRWPEGLTQQ